jgi:hypothetical protein
MRHGTQTCPAPRQRLRLNCETPNDQRVSGKRGGKAKLDANQLDALWDEVQAQRAATFRWTAPA